MKKTKKKILSLLLTAALVASLMPSVTLTAWAASDASSYKFDISEGNITVSQGSADGYITVTYGSTSTTTADIPYTQMLTIIGTSTSYRVTVGQAITKPVNITLSNVNIDVSGPSGSCAFAIGTGSPVNLTLIGTNTLKSGQYNAGLQVPVDAALTITAASTGSLTATGGKLGAGIGGNGSENGKGSGGGTVTVTGGTVISTGGTGGAGIGGGGNGGAGGSVTITGGTVISTGGSNSAGIGGGNGSMAGGSGGTVNVTGGTVTATGGESGGAGIGGGTSSYGGKVTVTGGIVTATGGAGGGAGIGGGTGIGGDGGTVTVTGGTVTATGGSSSDKGSGADIGKGVVGSGAVGSGNGNLYISGGSVDAITVPTSVYKSSAQGASNVYKTTVKGLPKSSAFTCSINGGPEFSCATDASGYLYLWLPTDDGAVQVTGDSRYFKASGPVTTSNNNVFAAAEYLKITTDSLPQVAVGTAYSQTLSVSGGSGSYIWSITSGTLPVGLSFSSGIISGTPTETGEYSFTILATDSATSSITGSQTLSITVYQTFSVDLSELSVTGGTLSPAFDRDIAAYAVTGSFGDSISITATMVDSGSTMTIGGQAATSSSPLTVSLSNGANLIPVTVTSSDGLSQKSYILSVNGTVNNAELGSLSIGSAAQTVNASTSSYTYSVGSDVTLIDIKASPSDSKAIMLLNGAILKSGVSGTVPLSVGENTVTLMVVAQDATTKTYTITVNRGTSDATLSNMTLSAGTLSPSYASTTYSGYTATVSNSTDSLTVTPTASDNNAKVTVNGTSATTVPLSVGDNVITVKVTGKDNVTTKTYTITVTRQSAITISTVSLPIGIVGASYSKTLSATGGSGSYTWSWVAASGSALPSAFTLSTAGVLSVTSGVKLTDTDIGSYTVDITVTDVNDSTVKQTQEFTLTIRKGCGNGAYLIESDGDAAYTGSYTDDGIPTLTVNAGVTGFTYFGVNITAVTGHTGTEVCVFVHMRSGQQIGINATKGDFDTLSSATAAFNVNAGDVIKVYIVDKLTNLGGSPSIL